MLPSAAASASVVRLPWDSGGVTDSHALRWGLLALPEADLRSAAAQQAYGASLKCSITSCNFLTVNTRICRYQAGEL